MNAFNFSRSTVDKYLPWALGAVAVWFTARAIKRSFWTLFGIYWVMRSSGMLGH